MVNSGPNPGEFAIDEEILAAVREQAAETPGVAAESGADGGSGARAVEEIENAGEGGEGPRVRWLPEYAGMRLALAVCAARGAYVQEAEKAGRKDGRITVDEKCRIVRVITLAWMRVNGAFFVDKAVMGASTAFYWWRKGGRFFRLASEEFASWLVAEIGMEPTSREVVNALKAVNLAAVDGRIASVVEYRRYFAHVGDVVYMSCGEDEVVCLSRRGVERRANGHGGIFFPPDSVLPKWRLLPEGEETDPLSTALYGGMESVVGERARTLLKLWLCALPFDPLCKPLLVFAGGVGSGKTKTATGVFRILGVEPRTCDFSRDSKPEDFWTAVNRGGVMTVDNVDAKIPWLPGALAAASTGGSMESRKLYSDSDTVVRRAQAWIVVTTASPQFAQDAGCADRILSIELFRRDKPTADSALDAELAEKRDGIISYIARAVRGAMAVEDAPPDGLNRRHPDWAAWAWRVGVALRIREAAEEALFSAEDDKSLFTIMSDETFGAPFVRFMNSRDHDFEGTAGELLQEMIAARVIEDDDRKQLSSKSIGRRLNEKGSWPFYRKVFGASARQLAGRIVYRFSPQRGGLGGFNDHFSSLYKENNFSLIKDEKGGSNPPNPPADAAATPPQAASQTAFGDFPVAPYDPGDPLL